MSYNPVTEGDQVSRSRAFFAADAVEESQRPHIFLNPTVSLGGTLVLPFIWYNNALSIPQAEWTQMGTISMRTLQTLESANGALSGTNISVFAWAEDVSLAIPTSANPAGLLPQSGDEYTSGTISTPAAVVAGVARNLSMIPVLRPYALASEMLATTTVAIAKAFGYSRPLSVADVTEIRIGSGRYANTNVPDNSAKLTLDIKQEVTPDSRVVGLDGTDEMTIRSIVTRESYLSSFSWTVGTSAPTTLWSSLVTPSLYLRDAEEYHLTPLCFGSIPFKYWRGSIKYRFQIVSSSFHKGRLKISWDPVLQPNAETNVAYTHIVDVSTEKDFTITVGWGSKYPFLEQIPLSAATERYFDNVLPSIPADNFHNGVISVQVLNELTVPAEGSGGEIQANVFVSAGDDFEVVCPDTYAISQTSFFLPQSGEEPVLSTDSIPIMEETSKIMGNDLHGSSDVYKVLFGDPVTSVRQLVKRFTLHHIYVPTRVTDALVVASRPDFPFYRGSTAEGIHELGTTNHANMTFLNWFTPAYACRRGGVRWKYHLANVSSGDFDIGVNVQRATSADAVFEYTSLLSGTPDQIASFVGQHLSLNAGGVVNSRMQPIAEVELPYHTNRRFWFGKYLNMTTTRVASDYHDISLVNLSNNVANTIFVNAYTAGADDFSLSCFVSTPVIFLT